jgi:hypothetical protein
MSKPRANKPNALTTIPRLPGKITATSWTPPTSGMSYEQWLATGKRIIAIGIASAWWIGDWWNASVAYGERVESAGHLPLSLKTIRTYAWVAQNVSIRMDTLSFSHHSIVASLPAAEQKQWLGRAAKQHWSVERMREAIEHRESTIGTFPAGVAARGDAEPADDAEAAEAADAAAQPSRDNNIFDGVFDDDDGEVSIQPPDGPAGDDDRPGVEQVLARYLKGINAMLDVVKPSMRELLIGDDTVEVATKLRLSKRGGDDAVDHVVAPWRNATKEVRSQVLESIGIDGLVEAMPTPMRAKLFALVELEVENRRERERPADRPATLSPSALDFVERKH